MIDLADLKTWLGVSGTTHDAALTALEERAVAIVERSLDWYFGPPRPAVEILDGTNTWRMFLRQPPVGGEVVLSTRSSVRDPWREIEAVDWEIDGRGLYCAPGHLWARGRRNFRAEYEEGFSEPPGDVVQLVYDLVAGIWKRRGSEGLLSERIGDYNYTLADVQRSDRWVSVRMAWKRGRV